MKPGDLMLIRAYAGGGKTTLLQQIAEANAGTPILYLCFNADLAREAKGKFPEWVKCATIHSIAFATVGRMYANSGKLSNGSLRPKDVMEILGTKDNVQGQYISGALNAFLCSTDSKPNRLHLEAGGWDEEEEEESSALENLTLVWERMLDLTDKHVPITHDGYLKAWGLEKPDLSHYPIILLDEAQDQNPVVLEVILAQRERGCKLGFVGDTHQSLYGFRGSVNAMEQLEAIATHKFSLTRSFRFGQHIADFASDLLNEHKHDPVRLIGLGRPRQEAQGTHCFIARTNAKLFARALEALRTNKKLHFAATRAEDNWNPWGPYKFQETLDVYQLFARNRSAIKTPWIAKYENFAEANAFALGDEAGKGGDAELKAMIDFVIEHGSDTRRILDRICSNCTSPDVADLHLSSAHRSKGKEWTSVTLADDFIPLDDAQKVEKLRARCTPREFVESINLLYVAITRARQFLSLPASSVKFFTENVEQVRAAS